MCPPPRVRRHVGRLRNAGGSLTQPDVSARRIATIQKIGKIDPLCQMRPPWAWRVGHNGQFPPLAIEPTRLRAPEVSDAPIPADSDTLTARPWPALTSSWPMTRSSQLDRYCRLAWEWNEKLNLTRHTDYEKFVSRDVVDSPGP